MARPAKPIDLLTLQGTVREDRHGHRAKEPKSGGKPERPEWLDGDGAAMWDAVDPKLAAMGISQSIDTFELSALCRWWEIWRAVDRKLKTAIEENRDAYKLIIQAGLAWKSFDKIASKFGFTPQDRIRLATSEETDGSDPLVQMLRERMGMN